MAIQAREVPVPGNVRSLEWPGKANNGNAPMHTVQTQRMWATRPPNANARHRHRNATNTTHTHKAMVPCRSPPRPETVLPSYHHVSQVISPDPAPPTPPPPFPTLLLSVLGLQGLPGHFMPLPKPAVAGPLSPSLDSVVRAVPAPAAASLPPNLQPAKHLLNLLPHSQLPTQCIGAPTHPHTPSRCQRVLARL
jgi:hypothetical protein